MRKLEVRTIKDVSPTRYLDECLPLRLKGPGEIDVTVGEPARTRTFDNSGTFTDQAICLGTVPDKFSWELVEAQGFAYLVAVKK
jgi:hypothetical protein